MSSFCLNPSNMCVRGMRVKVFTHSNKPVSKASGSVQGVFATFLFSSPVHTFIFDGFVLDSSIASLLKRTKLEWFSISVKFKGFFVNSIYSFEVQKHKHFFFFWNKELFFKKNS